MDTLLKSVENKLNTSISDKTAEMPTKKPKQLTLFDMKGKGKFNISSTENDKLNNSLNNSMLNSSKQKNEDLENSIEVIDSDVDVVEDNFKEITKLINTSAKKLEQTGKISNEKSAEKKLKKEKPQETKKNGNIMSFFDKSEKNTASPFPPKKSEKKPAKINLEEVGKKALVDENRSGELNEKLEFKNEMFADIACLIETYNTFIHLYFTRSRKLAKVDCKKIEFKAFLQMLKYDTKESKELYIKFIKNLLVILFEHEKSFEKIELFDKHITDFSQNICFLQELCRVVVSVIDLNLESKNDDVLFDCKNYDNQDSKYDLINELRVNLSQEPFSDLSLNSKINLIKTLCDQILVGEKFLSECERLESAAHQNRQNIRLYQSELIPLIGTSNYSKCPAEKLEPKNVKTLIRDIERNKEELNATLELIKKFERIEPLAVDKDGNKYWNFSFIKGIVLEVKTENENKSKWYLFETKSQIKQIQTFLKDDQKDLAKIFTEYMSNLEESIVEPEIVEEEKTEQVEKEDIKSRRKSIEKFNFGDHFERFERRSARLSSKALSVTEEERRSITIGKDVEINEQEEEECKEEKYKHIDWFHNLTDELSYPIEDLFIYLVNELLTIDFIGFGSLTRNSENEEELVLNQIINHYREKTDIEEKLNATKNILLEIFATINKNYVEFKFYNQINKEGFKYPLWRSYLQNAKSLSSIYFLSYILISELKWDGLKRKGQEDKAPKEKCMNCDKGGLKYTKITGLNELDLNKVATQGCVICFNCSGPIHKSCIDESTKHTKLSYRCKKCEQARLKYTLVEDKGINGPEKGFSAEISEGNYVPGVRTRKQRTSVEHNSTSQCSSRSNSRRNSESESSQIMEDNEYKSKTNRRQTASEKNSIKLKKHEEKCMKIALKMKSKMEKNSTTEKIYATGTRSSTRSKIISSSSHSENDSDSESNPTKKLRTKSFYSKNSESLTRTRSLRSTAAASTTSETSETSSRQKSQKKSIYCEESSTEDEN